MKIVATYTWAKSVGAGSLREYQEARVFESTQTLDDIIAWAKTISPSVEIFDLSFARLSAVLIE
jgi:hypothetical protein